MMVPLPLIWPLALRNISTFHPGVPKPSPQTLQRQSRRGGGKLSPSVSRLRKSTRCLRRLITPISNKRSPLGNDNGRRRALLADLVTWPGDNGYGIFLTLLEWCRNSLVARRGEPRASREELARLGRSPGQSQAAADGMGAGGFLRAFAPHFVPFRLRPPRPHASTTALVYHRGFSWVLWEGRISLRRSERSVSMPSRACEKTKCPLKLPRQASDHSSSRQIGETTKRSPRRRPDDTGWGVTGVGYDVLTKAANRTPNFRIGPRAQDLLRQMGVEEQRPMQSVLDGALEQYRRVKFLRAANADFSALRSDPSAWKDERSERERWEQTLGDGLAKE